MKNINSGDFIAESPFKLTAAETHISTKLSKAEIKEELQQISEKLSAIQDTIYAHNKYAVLVCLQGMDTAGKDSLIKAVFSSFNPRGVVVHSFKTPSELELEHDYLWRHYLALPERGKFAIFNRSHYENVLVTRVNPSYILNENLPSITSESDISQEFWENRFTQINNFESHIQQNGTIVFKFFLNLSKEEQRKRLLRRLEKESHNWKFSPGDLVQRKRWDDYMNCYEEAINKTHTKEAPWYVIPADDKNMARLLVAKILLKNLEKYTDIKKPELAPNIQKDIAKYKEILSKKEMQ
ncbi:MAG: polyphosphate kinase 2 family protein [Sphingobacteriales bacterium]|nr:polyphosphate kinase 2 family protein [Sphingobacteriales bacterium]